MVRPGNTYWNCEKKMVYEAEVVRLIKMSPEMGPKKVYDTIMSTFPELNTKITLKALSHIVTDLKKKEEEKELKIKEEERKMKEMQLNKQLDSLKNILLDYDITEIPDKNSLEMQTNSLMKSNIDLSKELNMLRSSASNSDGALKVTKFNSEIQLYSEKIEEMDQTIINSNSQLQNAKKKEADLVGKKINILELNQTNWEREFRIRKLIKTMKKTDAFEDPKRILHYVKTLLERKNDYDGKDPPQRLWEKVFRYQNYGKYFSNSQSQDYEKLFRKIFVGPNLYRNKIVHENGYIDSMPNMDLEDNRKCCGKILDLLKELDNADMKMYDQMQDRTNKNPEATLIGFTNTEMMDRYSNLTLEMNNELYEDKSEENDGEKMVDK